VYLELDMCQPSYGAIFPLFGIFHIETGCAVPSRPQGFATSTFGSNEVKGRKNPQSSEEQSKSSSFIGRGPEVVDPMVRIIQGINS
jgi:hypothetical protein